MKCQKLETRFLLLASCLLLLVSPIARAAPIEGQGIVAIFFEPLNPTRSKIDQINVDVETILQFSLAVSGLSLTSTSAFSFKGAEFQAFELHAGTMVEIRNAAIFAPNILEVDDDPFWTIQLAAPDPGGLVGLPLRMFIGELASPLDLAKLLAPTVDEPLQLRKFITQLSMNVLGVRFSVTLLMANFGSVEQPSFHSGLIFEAGGLTIGGIEVLSQTYIGARQGWECFGECKPAERYFEGRVVPEFEFQEEKLFIRNLTIAGATFGAEIAFDFTTMGFSELVLSLRVAVLGIILEQVIVFNDLLNPTFVSLGWAVRIGEGVFELELIDPYGLLQFPIKRLSFFVELGPISFKDEVVLQNPLGLMHVLEIGVQLESLRLRSQTAFLGGLINGFYNQKVTASWGFSGPGRWAWQVSLEVQMRREYLLYVSPSVSVEF